MTRKARILIVDDHPAVREGLAWRMAGLPDMEICGEASDVEQALQQCDALRPDLVIVDISLKRRDGLELIKHIAANGSAKTVVHSAYDEALYAERALEAGALGYIHKEEASAKVIEAIREVLRGRIYLSPDMTQRLLLRRREGVEPVANPVERLTDRELEIFRLIGQGVKSGEIARQLFLSPHTLDTHRANIKRKLQLKDAAELSRAASVWVHEQP